MAATHDLHRAVRITLSFMRGTGGSPVIRALIASPVRIYAQALAATLPQKHRLQIVGMATNSQELSAQLRRDPPDIVLLDSAAPRAVLTLEEIKRLSKNVKIVAIATVDDEQDILRLAEAGVAGYVSPDGSLDDVIVAMESAAQGVLRVSPRVAYRLLRHLGSLSDAATGGDNGGAVAALTDREREILALVDRGFSNKDIARDLKIQVGTAKNHVHNILKKLNVHRRINASAWFRKAGFHVTLDA